MAADISHTLHRLPEPGPEALAQSDALMSRISARARQQGGRLTLGEYMHAALYEPGLGYYVSGHRKFGAAGDFITAPELGRVFASCCARAFARVLGNLTEPVIVELGAGTGRFAHDVLLELEHLEALPDRYQILEVSAELSARQKRLIATLPAHLSTRVSWLDAAPCEKFEGIVFGNEVIDAMPVERFTWNGMDDIQMDFVTPDEDGLQVISVPASPSIEAHVRELYQQNGRWSAPYVSEVRPGLGNWLDVVTASLVRGVVMFVDYGTHATEFYHEQRSAGTLLCHYRHRAHADLLRWPGLQDITAWVDFSALLSAATTLGFTLDGYTTQAHFLIDCDLDEIVSEVFSCAQTQRQIELAGEIKRLTLPGEMGERFKVIAFRRGTKNGVFTPGHTGFERYLGA